MRLLGGARTVLTVLAAAGLLLTGCGKQPAVLIYPGSGTAGAEIPTPADSPHSFGGLVLCVRGGHQVTVTDVEPIKPTPGFRLVRYALRPSLGQTQEFGDGQETLTAAGFPDDPPYMVLADCHKISATEASYAELGLELERQTDSASAAGFWVSYKDGGHSGRVLVPFSVSLCSQQTFDAKKCVSRFRDIPTSS